MDYGKGKNKRLIGVGFFLLIFFSGEVFLARAEEVKQGIRSIQTASGWDEVKIGWEKNEYLSETQSIILVRQKDRCPKDLTDGEEVYRGNGFQFEDKNVLRGEKYCYGVGILELSGGSSSFRVSRLTESVSFAKRIARMFESKLNLLMLFEVSVLLFLIFLGKWKRRRSERAKAKLVLRKL
jgi:hypothetical protein